MGLHFKGEKILITTIKSDPSPKLLVNPHRWRHVTEFKLLVYLRFLTSTYRSLFNLVVITSKLLLLSDLLDRFAVSVGRNAQGWMSSSVDARHARGACQKAVLLESSSIVLLTLATIPALTSDLILLFLLSFLPSQLHLPSSSPGLSVARPLTTHYRDSQNYKH